MDDGGASSNSIIVFAILLILEILFYGFSSAMQNRKVIESEDSDREEAEETDNQRRKRERLSYLLDNHAKYANAIQLGVITTNLLLGAFILYRVNSYFGYVMYRMAVNHIGGLQNWHVSSIAAVTAVVVTIFLLYIVMTFGVLVPKKAASKYPDKWITCLITPFYYYVRIVSPFTGLVYITSKIVLHLLGIRNADDQEDVTEEEILSMVNVGHEQGDEVIAVNIPEAEMIVVNVRPDHADMIPKVCYEIGNKHAALLYGDTPYEFITPYNGPTYDLLGKLHGVSVRKEMRKMDFDRRISTSVNAHTH